MKKPTITEVLSLIKEYYSIPGNSVGGSLHIVLDDGKVKRENERKYHKFTTTPNNNKRRRSHAWMPFFMERC